MGGSFSSLLFHPHFCDSESEFSYSADYSHAFGDADGAARIQQVEKVRTFQGLIVSRQHTQPLGKGGQQALALLLVQLKELPKGGDVGQFKVVDRKLLLILEAHIVIADARRPLDV